MANSVPEPGGKWQYVCCGTRLFWIMAEHGETCVHEQGEIWRYLGSLGLTPVNTGVHFLLRLGLTAVQKWYFGQTHLHLEPMFYLEQIS